MSHPNHHRAFHTLLGNLLQALGSQSLHPQCRITPPLCACMCMCGVVCVWCDCVCGVCVVWCGVVCVWCVCGVVCVWCDCVCMCVWCVCVCGVVWYVCGVVCVWCNGLLSFHSCITCVIRAGCSPHHRFCLINVLHCFFRAESSPVLLGISDSGLQS